MSRIVHKRIRDEINNIPQVTIPQGKDKVPCHKLLLSINSFGDLFPCCRQLLDMKIGNIKDNNIINKLYNYKPKQPCSCSIGELGNIDSILDFRHVNIELAGPCNGGCVYCFQKNLSTFNRPVTIYQDLTNLLLALKPKSIMIFGGEIGVQIETIRMLENFKDTFFPYISVATNGVMEDKVISRLLQTVNHVEVTFNGFSNETVSAVSRIPYLKQLTFVRKAINKCKVSVKLLVNPINVIELPKFLNWALKQPFDHVLIDVTIVTPDDYAINGKWGNSILSFAKDQFWKYVFDTLEPMVKEVISIHKKDIITNDTSLIISPEIRNLLKLEDSFFKSLALSDSLNAKNVSISTRAWKTLL